MKLKLLIITCILFLGSFASHASHFAGGNIYYDYLGGNQYRFWGEITLDCGGAGNPPTMNIVTTNTCGFTNPAIVLTLVGAQTRNVSQVCIRDSLLTRCVGTGGTLPGRRRYIYSGTVTLPPCNTWTFGWGSCCRNAAVVNVTSTSIYMITTMNSATDSTNSSVRYFGHQNPYVCINQPATYNFGAYDPDGDSLSYQLIPGLLNATTNVTYSGGYNFLNPINTGFALNPTNGTITFTPNTLGSFVVVVKVTEWDSAGNIVGTTMRDIQVVVYNCYANIPPDPSTSFLYNVVGQGTVAGPKKLEVCEGDTFCVNFQLVDSNATDTLKLWSTNITSLLPGATLTYTGTNPITATLCWAVPTGAPALNNLSLVVSDGACPVPAQASFSILIEVIKSTYVSPDVTICLGDSTNLVASGGATFNWYNVAGPPLIVGTNFSCDSCSSSYAFPTSTSTYEVVSNLSGGCKNRDTVTVTVAPNITYTLSQTAAASCKLDPISFNITPTSPGTFTYQWIPANMLTSSTTANTTLNPTQSGTFNYTIKVRNTQGCVKTDVISVYVSNGSKPDIQAFTDKDTLLCNQSAILTAWVDSLKTISNLTDNFDNPLSPFGFLSTIQGGNIGTGCGANSLPNSMNFNGTTRVLQTANIQTSNCTTVEYSIKLGTLSSGSGCDNVENGDHVLFQYSSNGGASWTTLRTHTYLGWLVSTGWQNFSSPMPAGGGNKIFRWYQPSHGGPGQDNWAIDDIKISCSSLNNLVYNWTPTANLGTPNSTTTTATPTVSTNYQLISTDTTGGCADTAYVFIETLTDFLDVGFTVDTTNGCNPVTIEFTHNVNSSDIGTILWDFGDGSTSNVTSNPVSHTYSTPGTYSLNLTLTSKNGCVTDTTIPNFITVYPMPIAKFDATPQPTNISNTRIYFYDLSSSFVNQWDWNFGITDPSYNNTSVLQNPDNIYPDKSSGIYPVQLAVNTPYNCRDTVTRNVIIDGLYTIYLPSSFSPNGDGLNDNFGPVGEQISPVGYQFMIFNRWGELIFSTTDLKEKWDGKVSGTDEFYPEGVYVWRILAKDNVADEKHDYTGHVTLLRKQK